MMRGASRSSVAGGAALDGCPTAVNRKSHDNISDTYQPLAAYGPVAGGLCRERRFLPEVTNADVVASAAAAVELVRRVPGFRWLAMVRDGRRARALAFWRSRAALDHYDAEYAPQIRTTVERQLPRDPWTRGVAERRVGLVLLEVTSPSLPPAGGAMSVWDPPGAFLADDIGAGESPAVLAEMVRTRAVTELDRLVGRDGFQLLALVAYDDGALSLYVGYRQPHTARSLAAMPEILELRTGLNALAKATGASVERHDGELVAWYLRHLSG
jgi:hypothetical protein